MAEELSDLAAKLALAQSVELVHGRATCDEAGRPLFAYVCDYHQGYQDGLERAARWGRDL